MTASSDDLPLAAEFAPATYAQWRKLVDGVLKGGSFERLVAKTYDGLAIAPLSARRADAQPVSARAPGAAWRIVQRVDHPDPAAANAEALHDLENGATGLSLVFAGATGAYGYGLTASGIRSRARSTASISTPASRSTSISARRARTRQI